MNSFSRLTILSVGVFILLTSCAKEDDVQPMGNTGSGPNASFLGNWYVEEVSKLYGPATYNIYIADSSDNNFVLISYLYGYKTKITATTSNSSNHIPSQVIEANAVSGNGTLVNNSRIQLIYYVDNGFEKDTINAVLTK